MTTRAELAAAVSLVDGCRGYEERPSVVEVGDAWPLVESYEVGPGQAVFMTTWRVVVILGADEDEATANLPVLLPALCTAITQNAAYVDQATPGRVVTEAGDLPAVEIRARAEGL